MIIKKYEYKGEVYNTEESLRQAIFKYDRKVFGQPKNKKEWSELGVVYSERKVSVSSLKEQKMQELKNMFEEYLSSKDNHFKSSLGFLANGTLRSQTLIEGLVLQAEDGNVDFRTYDNKNVTLSLENIKIIRKEISKHITNLYNQKWELEKLIDGCTKDTIDDIIIEFKPSNFYTHIKILQL